MSQTKAQLIQPIGVVTTSGVVVTGVMTASSFDGVVTGSASSVTQGKNLNLGAVNAVSFAGDFTGNATGIITSSAIKVGSLTASSFVGDFTGTATSMAKGTGFKAGTVTATPANVTYTVTVGSKTGGGNAYYLDGTEAPTPSLYPGATYTFDQAAGTNATHPLRFATAADAAGSTEYTFQVTTNGTPGSAGAYTRIVVSPSAPDTLYYYCTNHSGMGDSINITNLLQGPVTGAVTGDVKGNIDGDLTGNLTGDVTGNVTGNVTGVSTGNVTGNVTGNLVGVAGSVVQGTNIHVGVVTVTGMSGDGSNLTGIAATNYNTQTVTANSGTTAIDLSAGNMITFNQSSNTTVSFASTSTAMDVTIIRVKDANDTARTITWPDSVKWNGGSAPTLITDSAGGDNQQFQFLTRDGGLTWYGWEPFQYDLSYIGLLTWGQNTVGQLGINDLISRSSPTQVGGLINWANTAGQQMGNVGDQGAAALKTDGTLWIWGQNYYGNLGLGAAGFPESRSSPTQVGTETTWSSWSMGYQGSTMAVKTDGTLWTWGKGGTGQLGHNDRANRSSPMQVPGSWAAADGSKIATGLFTGVINTSGELFTMGYNTNGELGQNDRNRRSSPTQVGTNTTWKSFEIGDKTGGGLKTNGTLWSWGENTYGQLGRNDRTHRSSPTQIPGSWSQFSYGQDSGIAIKTDGSLWSWGRNTDGALGQNQAPAQLTARSSPTQVGTDTTWSQFNGSMSKNVAALKTDGSLWIWGSNAEGYLGLNQATPVSLSSPTQIPGTYKRIIGNARAFSVLK